VKSPTPIKSTSRSSSFDRSGLADDGEWRQVANGYDMIFTADSHATRKLNFEAEG
jgi:hypothetical protein